MPPHTILVIEDDPQIRTLLRNRFEKDGFRVFEARNGAESEAVLGREPVSLITLDLTLGAEDGLAIARTIRARLNIPIIIVSAKDDEVDRIVGLELGADDYVTKPFSPREIVARVRAVLRRYEGAPNAPGGSAPAGYRAAFDGHVLDAARRELTGADGVAIELTTAEFNLLEILMRHPQRVLTRDELMNVLKGHDWNAFDRSIDSAIARLRRKIEPDADKPRHIKTVRGVGYVFASDVRRLDSR